MDLGKIGEFSVRSWQFTLVVFAGLVIFGLNALMSIPRQEDPTFPIPIFVINTILPGADPAEIEKLVTDPLEDVINGIDDLKQLRSISVDGQSIVTVEFDWSTDPEKKYDELLREVNAARSLLPEGIARLKVDRVGTRRTNIIQFSLISEDASFRDLRKTAEDIQDAIDRVPGVWETAIWGIPGTEVRVSVDLGRLAALGIPLDAVANALRLEGAEVPAGSVHAGARRFTVKGSGTYDDVAEVANTTVLSAGGRAVKVRDVADVDWADDEATHLAWANGKRAVFVTATMKDAENIFDVRKGILAAVDLVKPQLPANMTLDTGFDQSKNVEHRLSQLVRDFVIALALVLITLLPLGFRASIVVMISIPLSLAVALGIMQLIGFTINQLSITGFVLALGLLVDDSIVVTENIARHLREGKSRVDAAIAGLRQIAVAVVGCTATLMLAFVPLLFLPEGAGRFIRVLPTAVLLSVGASFFIALTIIPFLASRILKDDEDPEGNVVLRGVMGGIHAFYRPLLHAALSAPRFTILLATIGFLITVPLFGRLGFSLFPPAETPQFIISIDLPEGAALSETAKALSFVQNIVAKTPQVQTYLSNLGHGNPQVFYNVRPKEFASNHAAIMVALKEWEGTESHILLDQLRAQFAAYPGAKIAVLTFDNGPPIEAPVAVRIAGDDLDVLKKLAAEATFIIEDTPGTRDIDNPVRYDRTDLDLGFDENKAAALGVPPGAVDRTVRLALEGETVASYREADGDEFPVVVRLPFEQRNNLDALDRIYVPSGQGAAPLSLVTHPRFTAGPARIDRFQRQRAVTITAYVKSGFLTSSVNTEVFKRIADLKLPPGYRVIAGGVAEAQARSFAGLGNAVILALFGIFAVLILEFRSFAATAVVAGVIPLGIMGGLLALWLTGYSISFTAAIGFIALIGIEIKNSILLVDFTNQLRREGVGLRDAIEQAGEIRFLPVLLTSVTAIFGLLPLAIEDSGLYSPLALVIIGGLITSTFLSRIVTPAMYLLLAPSDARFALAEGLAVPVPKRRRRVQPAE